MDRSLVTAATGALGPVLTKLTDFLDHQIEFPHLERWRQDIEFIRSELDSVHSLLLSIWDREDLRLDAACNHWMADARKLSYSMEEQIDGILADGSCSGLTTTQPETDARRSPFEGLKKQVQDLVNRCSEDWKNQVATTSEPHQPEANVVDDPRSGFLHKDSLELVETEEKKFELIRLLQEHHTVCIAGFVGLGKTTLADQVYQAIGEKFECQAFVSVSRRPNLTRILTSLLIQVMASAITNKRKVVVTDSLDGTVVLERDRFVRAIIDILYEDVLCKFKDKQKIDQEVLKKMTEPENKLINKIHGFLGREVSANTQLQGTGAEEKPDLVMSITEFLGKKRMDKTVDDFKKYLKKIISRLLEDKRYLVIVDDIWDWKDWEFIRNDTLPKINNLGSRIITTTRYKAIAQKYQMDNNSFVYEIAGLSPDAATALSERIFKKSGKFYNIPGPCSSIAKMTRGMPLAIICMSSAVAEQLPVQDGQAFDDHERFHVAESRALERFLTIPCLRLLVESFSHVYHELPLHLKTCLLHCCIYPPYHIFVRNDLIRIWIAEGFVHEEKEAQGYIDELINKGFIRPNSSTATPAVALKYGCHDSAFPQFEHLQMLHIHGGHLTNAVLDDICGLLELRCLSLRVALINILPKEIRRLQNLKTLDVSNTGILGLPKEIGELKCLETLDVSNTMITELPKEIRRLQQLKTLNARNSCVRELPKEIRELQHLETLDISYTMVVELPREIGELHLKTLDAGGTHIREVCKEIGTLDKLETLDLRSTMVTDLPKEIGELLCLKTLIVHDTMVTELPKEIGQLYHLEKLDVSCTMLAMLPIELGKLKNLKTLNISNTMVRELPWEAGGISSSVSVLVDDNDPPKVVTLLNKDGCRAWNEGNGSIAENHTDKLSITLFDHFGSSIEPLQFARFKIGERHMGVPMLVKDHLNDICCLEISVWKLEEKDFKFLGDMPKLHALALQLESRTRDPITMTSTGFLELESFSIDCRAPRVTFEERATSKLKHLDFKFYACRPSEHPRGIQHLQSLRSVTFRCGSPRYGSDAPGINAVINQLRKQAEENPNRITFCVNNNEEVYPEKPIELLEENGESTIMDDAGSSSASGLETSLFSDDIDEEGKISPVIRH